MKNVTAWGSIAACFICGLVSGCEKAPAASTPAAAIACDGPDTSKTDAEKAERLKKCFRSGEFKPSPRKEW
jgi:entry exclusion lipoprotein TrbK